MKKLNKENVLTIFEQNGSTMYEATQRGDYKTNNKAGRALLNIYKQFESNPKLAEESIPELLTSTNIVVRSTIAGYCLGLRKNVEQAEKVLEEISNNKEEPLYAFSAKMSLYFWRKNGYLTIYIKKGSLPNR